MAEVRIDAERLVRSLFAVVVLLVAAHVAGAVSSYVFHHDYVFGLVATFDLNVENNVPTFFSAFMLLACAVLLACVARVDGATAVADRRAGYWKGLAILFLFLAVDEDASLHELLIEPVRNALPMGGPLHFAWVVPYALVVLALGLLYLRFVWSLPPRTRRLFILAGGIFLSGAIGFELLEGWYLSTHAEVEDFRYSFFIAAEELLEMSGVVTFIYALLDYLRGRLGREPLRISISRA